MKKFVPSFIDSLFAFYVCLVVTSIFITLTVNASDWTDGMYLLEFNGIGESDTAKDMSQCNPAEISISNKKAVVEIYDCDRSDAPTSDCDLVVVMGENGLDGWVNAPAYETFYRGFSRAFVKDIGSFGGIIAVQCFGVKEKIDFLTTPEEIIEEVIPEYSSKDY